MEKSILIIGANGGLAVETIKHLINDGFKKIVMACRSEVKGIKAKAGILASVQNTEGLDLRVVGDFDMNNPTKIVNAVQSLTAYNAFNTVFLAAGGAVFTDDFQTIEWKEQQIEKNVFQNMMGSHLTLLHLKKNNLLVPGARVVLSGGEGARGIKGLIASPGFESPDELRHYVFANVNDKKYNPMDALGVSKLFGALWTSKIAELEGKNMDIIWFSPGLTAGTNGLSGLSIVQRWFMKNIVFNVMSLLGQAQGPVAGGRKFADCIAGKIGKNGDILGAPEGKSIGKITDQTPMNPAFTDRGLIDEFWTILEELFGPFPQAVRL